MGSINDREAEMVAGWLIIILGVVIFFVIMQCIF